MLNTNPNFAKPDEIYAKLISAHEGLAEQESHAMNARLVLLLMNHIGDQAVIEQALRAARNSRHTSAKAPP
jgi:Protein of unknown function (DUF2783)